MDRQATGPARGPGDRNLGQKRSPGPSPGILWEEPAGGSLGLAAAASGLTHLTCRPSCCTPRAGSSDTQWTRGGWVPRTRTPPGLRQETWTGERRPQERLHSPAPAWPSQGSDSPHPHFPKPGQRPPHTHTHIHITAHLRGTHPTSCTTSQTPQPVNRHLHSAWKHPVVLRLSVRHLPRVLASAKPH